MGFNVHSIMTIGYRDESGLYYIQVCSVPREVDFSDVDKKLHLATSWKSISKAHNSIAIFIPKDIQEKWKTPLLQASIGNREKEINSPMGPGREKHMCRRAGHWCHP